MAGRKLKSLVAVLNESKLGKKPPRRTAAGFNAAQTPTEADIIEVCDGIKEMLITKNRAYGDSALKPMRVFSRADNVEQIKVRLDDKISRLCRGHALPDESLADTVNDLMGYLVLLKIAVKRATNEGLGVRL